jgi:hypothetical protein
MPSNFADRPQSGPYLFRYNFKFAAKRPSMYRVSMTMAAIRPHRYYLTSLCINWAQFTHERVEYNVFLFDEPLKGSKSLKTFKISLTFRFDKL